ncbi:hypothetical protein CANCADRAFT_30980 [Tortispora caseinolytica NRRL Y-17796]|uniref:Uncharacterized protein n=1 Tax=Tortispora caseinolytica NRRL Y-17796 TaxID=767744 RepID=A0A1E4TDL4_9ASCO|nr:hypothetical protein CANCADRAFT_30980 [Tortispora caseinolytica NRRL Y-17796]
MLEVLMNTDLDMVGHGVHLIAEMSAAKPSYSSMVRASHLCFNDTLLNKQLLTFLAGKKDMMISKDN